MSGKYLIAVCDILGFSALVQQNSLADVVEHSVGWFRQALNHSVLKNSFPVTAPPTQELNTHQHVGVAWFSDTVLFYTKQDTDEAVRELLVSVGWLLFETMLGGRTRIRAGISYGEAHIDPENSLYVGSALIAAYDLEKAQQWSGGALTVAACARVPEMARSGKYADWWVTPWDVPLKNNDVLQTLAVNWNWGVHQADWKLRWSRESEMPTAEDWARDASVCEKFVNTKRFHEALCQDGCRESKPNKTMEPTR